MGRSPALLLALCVVPALALASPAASCSSDLDCSLNGVCQAQSCVCDPPWAGPACATLLYAATTPASGKNLYNTSDPNNTWNGPIVTAPDGTFHIYVPVYRPGSLSGPFTMKHGWASVVTGPYDWTSHADLPTNHGENPAALVYVDATTGETVYSLWIGGGVMTASSPDGPFAPLSGFSYPGGNPAPIFHNGAFYMTNQFTTQIYTTPALTAGAVWTVHANISHATLPTDDYHVEDPFLWVDRRGNWHIINHAYSNDQYVSCGISDVSAHFFSADGVEWTYSPQPYNHTVAYDDGTTHTYTTLERPNLHFTDGVITHINLAADLIVGDEGCANRTSHAHNGHTPCDK
jgi:hypothetical protein